MIKPVSYLRYLLVASIYLSCQSDHRYFKRRSLMELAESELHRLRFAACERIAKLMIDSVQDDAYLFTDMLLKRYHGSIVGLI
jgi:hypothetical protein